MEQVIIARSFRKIPNMIEQYNNNFNYLNYPGIIHNVYGCKHSRSGATSGRGFRAGGKCIPILNNVTKISDSVNAALRHPQTTVFTCRNMHTYAFSSHLFEK